MRRQDCRRIKRRNTVQEMTMEKSTDAILDQLVESCQEMVKLSLRIKGSPEEEKVLEILRSTATKTLAGARGMQICVR